MGERGPVLVGLSDSELRHASKGIIEWNLPKIVVSLPQLGGDDERLAVRPANIVDAGREPAELLRLAAAGGELPQFRVRAIIARLLAPLVGHRRVNDPLAVRREREAEVA